jgi:hypothetical protein
MKKTLGRYILGDAKKGLGEKLMYSKAVILFMGKINYFC